MIGKSVSHFIIQEFLGEGGMGKVYLALDTNLQRKVALKFLLTEFTEDEKSEHRFKQEAQTMAALNHPNITTIYEVGNYNQGAFIAMEYIEGESLEKLLPKKKMSIIQALEMVGQLCEGLREAHNQGIYHRDIKPGNILVDKNGRLKILDFGLAKLKETSQKTSKSTTVGTLFYLSPEQIQSSNVDQRADIFAVGIVLYQMLTGQLPFQGEHEASVIYSILNEEPDPLARYNSDVSEHLQHIINKALCKNPEMRYQHIDDLLSDIKRELNIKKTSSLSPQERQVKITRKLAAIMFTDIVGYSQMMGKDENATFKMLEDYDSIVSPIIKFHNGFILKKIGDGLFCEFASAIEAVECSIELQESLYKYNQTAAKSHQLIVRIGIHVGDVIKKDKDLFGDGVNVAARIEPLAPPGGIYVSDSVYSAISSHPKFKIINLGLSSLKNINKQHNLYQILSGYEDAAAQMPVIDTSRSDKKKIDKSEPFTFTNLLNKKVIFGASIFIIIVTAILLNKQIVQLISVFYSVRQGESSEQVNDTRDQEIKILLESDKFKEFKVQVLNSSNFDNLISNLDKFQNEGMLTYSSKKPEKLDGKYVVIFDEQQIYTILLCLNSEYIDTNSNIKYSQLSGNFSGKRLMYVELH